MGGCGSSCEGESSELRSAALPLALPLLATASHELSPVPGGHRGCARCSPDDTDSNGRLRCFASWLGNLTALPSLRTLPRFRSSLGNLPALPSLRTLPRFRSSLGNLPELFRSATGLTLYWRQMSRCLPTLAVCDACPTEGGS